MAQPFTAAPHHDVLVLLVQLSVLLFTARALGAVAKRMGQPTVVGEIMAGIVLGPSCLSKIFPFLREWIMPHTAVQGHLLEMVSLIGALFLLLITGMETDLALIRRQARSVIGVAMGGLLLPLVMGFLLGQLIPDEMLLNPEHRLVFSLFIAIALGISAIPVIAKVLMDLQLNRRNIGQAIIAAAMIDDTVGWILLSIVISLASGTLITPGSIAQSAFTVLAFMLLSLTVGRLFIGRVLRFIQNHVQMSDKVLSLAVLLMFVWGAIGQALGIEALMGAFVIGMVFSQLPQMNQDAIRKLESITLGIFAPIFFAVAGLKVHLIRLLFEPKLLIITTLVIGVAIVCKMVGVYIGARLIGKSDHWTSIFYGAGLNARGSIGIIIANIGLSLNILSQEMFSIIVVMAVFTSLMSPSVMRWAVSNIQLQPEEVERLKREELLKKSLLANVRRVLLPTRLREVDPSTQQLLEASVLQQMNATTDIALTMLIVTDTENYQASVEFLDKLAERFPVSSITKKVVFGEDIGNLILDEAKMDYDLMILGTPTECGGSDVLFTPLLDYLIHMSPCPTMLIKNQNLLNDWAPRRILVPSNGSQPSHRAAEVAFALAANSQAQITVLQVVEANRSDSSLDAQGALTARQRKIARESVEKLCELGNIHGIKAIPKVKIGAEPEMVILRTIQTRQIDLIVLGTSIGGGSNRLYLGPRVERILSSAPCPVIVLNT
jgi:Kef-type K+ transport system membrane component KefB